ncbi:MAG: AglZ/HisF2 family acetamidino modification protein [Hyphomicrobiales bacterium]
MLRARIIPTLLLENDRLVKTTSFSSPRYIGDPLNAVKIFNEMEADEIFVFDIGATPSGKAPDLTAIARLAEECRMPLCYGGGIASVDQAVMLISLGVEKIALGDSALKRPELITAIAHEVGSQSICAVLDVKTKSNRVDFEVMARRGTLPTGLEPVAYAKRLIDLGAGEVIFNCVDHDGARSGYALDLARRIADSIDTPFTMLGGAGSLSDIRDLLMQCGPIGAAAGSLFVYKGRQQAVLINYPTQTVREQLALSAHSGIAE